MDKQQLYKNLKNRNCRNIYLSHQPEQEQGARNFANELRAEGFEVTVAADVRPNTTPDLATPEQLKKVEDAIEKAECTLVYEES